MNWKFWKSCRHEYHLTQFYYYEDTSYTDPGVKSYKYSAYCINCGKTKHDSVFGGGNQIKSEHIVNILNKGHTPK